MVAIWRVRITVPDIEQVPVFEDRLEPDSISITLQELDGGPEWEILANFPDEPSRADIGSRIEQAADICGIPVPKIELEPERDIDWVAEYQKDTQPIEAGRFFVYPSHYDGALPSERTAIQMDAAGAFGTGDHETTYGCLLAIEALRNQGLTPQSSFDLGCGTGILAIAMAMVWPDAKIFASDIDPVAVATARENMILNNVQDHVAVIESVGWAAEEITRQSPFDLITANILAAPLMEMADEMRCGVTDEGMVVLSGILTTQAGHVSDRYIEAGFSLSRRMDEGDWAVLLMQASA